MKSTLLAFLLFSISSQIVGQDSKFLYSLEYSPNFISNTNPSSYSLRVDEGFRLAHNIFLKGGFRIATDLFVTAGVGYLSTREFVTLDFGGQLEIDKIEVDRYHSYVMVPVGIKYSFGPFFVSPEIGIGWNTGNRSKDHVYFSDGSQQEDIHDDDLNLQEVNEITYPIFLSFGNEVKMKNCSVMLGIKGYYSLNEIGNTYHNSGHYFGFGVIGGVKF